MNAIYTQPSSHVHLLFLPSQRWWGEVWSEGDVNIPIGGELSISTEYVLSKVTPMPKIMLNHPFVFQELLRENPWHLIMLDWCLLFSAGRPSSLLISHPPSSHFSCPLCAGQQPLSSPRQGWMDVLCVYGSCCIVWWTFFMSLQWQRGSSTEGPCQAFYGQINTGWNL